MQFLFTFPKSQLLLVILSHSMIKLLIWDSLCRPFIVLLTLSLLEMPRLESQRLAISELLDAEMRGHLGCYWRNEILDSGS